MTRHEIPSDYIPTEFKVRVLIILLLLGLVAALAMGTRPARGWETPSPYLHPEVAR